MNDSGMSHDLQAASETRDSSRPIVGIVIGPELLEDWLEHIDISFDAFLNEMMGSWMFGFIESLKLMGVEPVSIGVSTRVKQRTRFIHRPTGTVVCLLPPTTFYRAMCIVRGVF